MLLKETGTLPESEIIKRINEGETALFEILIRRNNPFLYKTGRSYGFLHHDVEDLMQQTFIAAFENLQKFENRSSFRTWLTRIMLNCCYHRKEKSSFRNEISLSSPTPEAAVPLFHSGSPTDINNIIMNKELREVIEKALMKIPLNYRIVFSLRELNEMTTSETAELLNISEANVKTRLNRAKVMMRKTVETMYAKEDIFEFNLIYCDRIVNNVMNALKLSARDISY